MKVKLYDFARAKGKEHYETYKDFYDRYFLYFPYPKKYRERIAHSFKNDLNLTPKGCYIGCTEKDGKVYKCQGGDVFPEEVMGKATDLTTMSETFQTWAAEVETKYNEVIKDNSAAAWQDWYKNYINVNVQQTQENAATE